MRYRSTRGGEVNLSFQDVLFAGYSEDGGLYMPESVPTVSAAELKAWATLSYRQLLYQISRKFIDTQEIPDNDLRDIIESAFRKFKSDEEMKLVNVTQSTVEADDIWILELFKGPTFAFKDLALSFVAGLLEYFLLKDQRHVTILVGTSGDTGGAAINAIEGRANMTLIVLLPRHRCTVPQMLQMVTSQHSNIVVYSVDGLSDDLDVPIKKCFASADFMKRHNLMSINSINWGRILGQVAHFFYSFFRRTQTKQASELLSVEIVLPTGAAGNITSGCLAEAMGLPVTLVAAVNTNDIMARAINGDFSIVPQVHHSLSSAMDIQMPYNFERMLYLFSEFNVQLVASLMKTFEEQGRVKIPDSILSNMKKVITDTCVHDDDRVLQVMRMVHHSHGYLLCPHTAVAVAYHYKCPPIATKPRLYIATASPTKFPEALKKALTSTDPKLESVSQHLPDKEASAIVHNVCQPLDHLKSLPTKSLMMDQGENWEKMLREKIEEINATWLNEICV
uniref:Threonine synthase-like 2 n=1 Tax=Hirondellea gigas TaxID=1518452 RepID=A0A2P2I671_9CRUS